MFIDTTRFRAAHCELFLPSARRRSIRFNTTGLWKLSRHPNYFAEQGTWIAFYIFSIGAGVGVFNWSVIGALLLVVLFLGSSALSEQISASKYPEYDSYCKSVSKFFPWR